MATNEILPFAGTVAADNLISQADYLADVGNIRTVGNQPGIADDRLVNKAARQSSLICAAIAKIAADHGPTNIVDTLTVTQMAAALLAGLNTGMKQLMLVSDVKATGASGGDSVIGNNTRDLNTVDYNSITGASLNSGLKQITLPAGSYLITCRVPAFGSVHSKAHIQNVTDSIQAIYSTNSDCEVTAVAPAGNVSGWVFIEDVITISGTKVFEVRHYFADAVTNGLGDSYNVGERPEIYTKVKIEKIA